MKKRYESSVECIGVGKASSAYLGIVVSETVVSPTDRCLGDETTTFLHMPALMVNVPASCGGAFAPADTRLDM